MASQESELKFLCTNYCYGSSYRDGKLDLPSPFFLEYGSRLPDVVYLHVYRKDLWEGRVDKESMSIVGLSEMIGYYKINSYHIVSLQYNGGSYFKAEIFNPYGVEINYDIDVNPLVVSSDMVARDYGMRRAMETYRYNVIDNFTSLFEFVIDASHVVDQHIIKVISKDDLSKLNVHPSVECLYFCLSSTMWSIKMNLINNELYFDKSWLEFVQANNLVAGDVVVLKQMSDSNKFNVAFFPKRILGNGNGLGDSIISPNFFKIMNRTVLEKGELEIPRVFVEKHGSTLANQVNVSVGGGSSFTFSYSSSQRRLYNMNHLTGLFKLGSNYFLFFDYLGESKFSLSIYNTQCMNHLRNVSGILRLEDFNVTDVSGESSSDDENENVAPNITFDVILKKSHVDQRGHGVYIPNCLSEVYNRWGSRKEVTLIYLDTEWIVEVIHKPNYCRFGLGWDEFTLANNFSAEDALHFEYMGDVTFQVTKRN